MSRTFYRTCFFGLSLVAAPAALPQGHPGKMAPTDKDSKLDSYMEQVSELSSRARANVYFPNHQSIYDGVQVGFVNVGMGNLTFLRRDMVTSGRIPLVLARVYDSASVGGTDFGPGWTLSAAETIVVTGHVARLASESGALIEFIETSGNTFLLKEERPSDYLKLVRTSPDAFRAYLLSGIVKDYRQMGDLFRLDKASDASGNSIQLTYANGVISRLENANHFLQFTRDGKGRIIAAQDDQGRNVQYVYNEKGLLIAVDDLGGNRWRYSYSGGSRLRRAIDPLQRENFSVEYEGTGRVQRLRLPSGVIHYSYDVANHLTIVRDRKELISRYFQNEDGITARVVNALGEETSILLDANRNVVSLLRDGTVVETMEYDQQHRLIARHSVTSAGTTDFRYSYDSQTSLLSRIVGSDRTSKMFSYDSSGRLATAALPDGMHTYTYSPSGDLSQFSADGVDESFSRNSDGLVVSMNEDGGQITTMRYRAGGELGQITFSDGETAACEYQASGLRTKFGYKDGRRVQYSYDPAGNLAGTKVFDATGKQIAGQTLVMDDSYQLVRWMLFNGREYSFQYDPNGNLTEWKQGKSLTRFEYDALNRIVAVITPNGERLSYSYKPGEPSLIEQYDHGTIAIADVRDTGFTFASQSAVAVTRPLPTMLGTVRFSEALGAFQLANPDGTEIVTPERAIEQPLQKMRLVAGGTPLRARQAEFSRPFNAMFMPSEYASINCCPLCTTRSCPSGCDNGGPLVPPIVTSIDPDTVMIGSNNVQLTIGGRGFGSSPTVNLPQGVTNQNSGGNTDIRIVITANFTFNATIGTNFLTVTNTDTGLGSSPKDFDIDGPDEAIVQNDVIGTASNNPNGQSRFVTYQVMNFSGSQAQGIPIAEVLGISNWNCTQPQPGNDFAHCDAAFHTDPTGTFTDEWEMYTGFTPVGCGVNITDFWQWCGPSAPAPNPGITFMTLTGFVHTADSQINSFTNPPNRIPVGQVFPAH